MRFLTCLSLFDVVIVILLYGSADPHEIQSEYILSNICVSRNSD